MAEAGNRVIFNGILGQDDSIYKILAGSYTAIARELPIDLKSDNAAFFFRAVFEGLQSNSPQTSLAAFRFLTEYYFAFQRARHSLIQSGNPDFVKRFDQEFKNIPAHFEQAAFSLFEKYGFAVEYYDALIRQAFTDLDPVQRKKRLLKLAGKMEEIYSKGFEEGDPKKLDSKAAEAWLRTAAGYLEVPSVEILGIQPDGSTRFDRILREKLKTQVLQKDLYAFAGDIISKLEEEPRDPKIQFESAQYRFPMFRDAMLVLGQPAAHQFLHPLFDAARLEEGSPLYEAFCLSYERHRYRRALENGVRYLGQQAVHAVNGKERLNYLLRMRGGVDGSETRHIMLDAASFDNGRLTEGQLFTLGLIAAPFEERPEQLYAEFAIGDALLENQLRKNGADLLVDSAYIPMSQPSIWVTALRPDRELFEKAQKIKPNAARQKEAFDLKALIGERVGKSRVPEVAALAPALLAVEEKLQAFVEEWASSGDYRRLQKAADRLEAANQAMKLGLEEPTEKLSFFLLNRVLPAFEESQDARSGVPSREDFFYFDPAEKDPASGRRGAVIKVEKADFHFGERTNVLAAMTVDTYQKNEQHKPLWPAEKEFTEIEQQTLISNVFSLFSLWQMTPEEKAVLLASIRRIVETPDPKMQSREAERLINYAQARNSASRLYQLHIEFFEQLMLGKFSLKTLERLVEVFGEILDPLGLPRMIGMRFLQFFSESFFDSSMNLQQRLAGARFAQRFFMERFNRLDERLYLRFNRLSRNPKLEPFRSMEENKPPFTSVPELEAALQTGKLQYSGLADAIHKTPFLIQHLITGKNNTGIIKFTFQYPNLKAALSAYLLDSAAGRYPNLLGFHNVLFALNLDWASLETIRGQKRDIFPSAGDPRTDFIRKLVQSLLNRHGFQTEKYYRFLAELFFYLKPHVFEITKKPELRNDPNWGWKGLKLYMDAAKEFLKQGLSEGKPEVLDYSKFETLIAFIGFDRGADRHEIVQALEGDPDSVEGTWFKKHLREGNNQELYDRIEAKVKGETARSELRNQLADERLLRILDLDPGKLKRNLERAAAHPVLSSNLGAKILELGLHAQRLLPPPKYEPVRKVLADSRGWTPEDFQEKLDALAEPIREPEISVALPVLTEAFLKSPDMEKELFELVTKAFRRFSEMSNEELKGLKLQSSFFDILRFNDILVILETLPEFREHPLLKGKDRSRGSLVGKALELQYRRMTYFYFSREATKALAQLAVFLSEPQEKTKFGVVVPVKQSDGSFKYQEFDAVVFNEKNGKAYFEKIYMTQRPKTVFPFEGNSLARRIQRTLGMEQNFTVLKENPDLLPESIVISPDAELKIFSFDPRDDLPAELDLLNYIESIPSSNPPLSAMKESMKKIAAYLVLPPDEDWLNDIESAGRHTVKLTHLQMALLPTRGYLEHMPLGVDREQADPRRVQRFLQLLSAHFGEYIKIAIGSDARTKTSARIPLFSEVPKPAGFDDLLSGLSTGNGPIRADAFYDFSERRYGIEGISPDRPFLRVNADYIREDVLGDLRKVSAERELPAIQDAFVKPEFLVCLANAQSEATLWEMTGLERLILKYYAERILFLIQKSKGRPEDEARILEEFEKAGTYIFSYNSFNRRVQFEITLIQLLYLKEASLPVISAANERMEDLAAESLPGFLAHHLDRLQALEEAAHDPSADPQEKMLLLDVRDIATQALTDQKDMDPYLEALERSLEGDPAAENLQIRNPKLPAFRKLESQKRGLSSNEIREKVDLLLSRSEARADDAEELILQAEQAFGNTAETRLALLMSLKERALAHPHEGTLAAKAGSVLEKLVNRAEGVAELLHFIYFSSAHPSVQWILRHSDAALLKLNNWLADPKRLEEFNELFSRDTEIVYLVAEYLAGYSGQKPEDAVYDSRHKTYERLRQVIVENLVNENHVLARASFLFFFHTFFSFEQIEAKHPEFATQADWRPRKTYFENFFKEALAKFFGHYGFETQRYYGLLHASRALGRGTVEYFRTAMGEEMRRRLRDGRFKPEDLEAANRLLANLAYYQSEGDLTEAEKIITGGDPAKRTYFDQIAEEPEMKPRYEKIKERARKRAEMQAAGIPPEFIDAFDTATAIAGQQLWKMTDDERIRINKFILDMLRTTDPAKRTVLAKEFEDYILNENSLARYYQAEATHHAEIILADYETAAIQAVIAILSDIKRKIPSQNPSTRVKELQLMDQAAQDASASADERVMFHDLTFVITAALVVDFRHPQLSFDQAAARYSKNEILAKWDIQEGPDSTSNELTGETVSQAESVDEIFRFLKGKQFQQAGSRFAGVLLTRLEQLLQTQKGRDDFNQTLSGYFVAPILWRLLFVKAGERLDKAVYEQCPKLRELFLKNAATEDAPLLNSTLMLVLEHIKATEAENPRDHLSAKKLLKEMFRDFIDRNGLVALQAILFSHSPSLSGWFVTEVLEETFRAGLQEGDLRKVQFQTVQRMLRIQKIIMEPAPEDEKVQEAVRRIEDLFSTNQPEYQEILERERQNLETPPMQRDFYSIIQEACARHWAIFNSRPEFEDLIPVLRMPGVYDYHIALEHHDLAEGSLLYRQLKRAFLRFEFFEARREALEELGRIALPMGSPERVVGHYVFRLRGRQDSEIFAQAFPAATLDKDNRVSAFYGFLDGLDRFSPFFGESEWEAVAFGEEEKLVMRSLIATNRDFWLDGYRLNRPQFRIFTSSPHRHLDTRSLPPDLKVDIQFLSWTDIFPDASKLDSADPAAKWLAPLRQAFAAAGMRPSKENLEDEGWLAAGIEKFSQWSEILDVINMAFEGLQLAEDKAAEREREFANRKVRDDHAKAEHERLQHIFREWADELRETIDLLVTEAAKPWIEENKAADTAAFERLRAVIRALFGMDREDPGSAFLPEGFVTPGFHRVFDSAHNRYRDAKESLPRSELRASPLSPKDIVGARVQYDLALWRMNQMYQMEDMTLWAKEAQEALAIGHLRGYVRKILTARNSRERQKWVDRFNKYSNTGLAVYLRSRRTLYTNLVLMEEIYSGKYSFQDIQSGIELGATEPARAKPEDTLRGFAELQAVREALEDPEIRRDPFKRSVLFSYGQRIFKGLLDRAFEIHYPLMRKLTELKNPKFAWFAKLIQDYLRANTESKKPLVAYLQTLILDPARQAATSKIMAGFIERYQGGNDTRVSLI